MRWLQGFKSTEETTSLNRSLSMAEKIAKALAVMSTDLPNPFDESTNYFRPFSAPFTADSPITKHLTRRA